MKLFLDRFRILKYKSGFGRDRLMVKWHMRLNFRKTKYLVVSWSRTNALGYGDLTLGGAELEKINSLRILGVTIDSKLPLETHMREVVTKAARYLGIVRRARDVFDCPRELKSCFKAYVFPAWSIMHPCGCRLQSLICICWMVLYAIWIGRVKVIFVIWGTEGRSVPCVCSIKFITEWTTLRMSICIILLQIVILELQLLWVNWLW